MQSRIFIQHLQIHSFKYADKSGKLNKPITHTKNIDKCKTANGSPFYRTHYDLFIFFTHLFRLLPFPSSNFLNGIFFRWSISIERARVRQTSPKNTFNVTFKQILFDLILLICCCRWFFSFLGQIVCVGLFAVHRYSACLFWLDSMVVVFSSFIFQTKWFTCVFQFGNSFDDNNDDDGYNISSAVTMCEWEIMGSFH